MNKWTKMAASTLVALSVLAPGLASANDRKTMVDYSQVHHEMKDGMDLVPLRKIAESLGYQVTWNNDERSVTLISNGMTHSNMSGGNMGSNMMDTNSMGTNSMGTNSMGTNMMDKNMTNGSMGDKTNNDMAYTVKIKIDTPEVWVGMSEKMLSYAPVIINDRTYVTKDFIEQYIANQMMK